MDDIELDNFRKKLANEIHNFSVPIDFEGLIKQGLLKKVGKSYYINDLNALPESVRKRIKTIANGRHGAKVTFYKETKSMKNLAAKLK